MAGKIDLYEDKWLNIVFNNKNQAYGAYQVRKSYAKNAMLGIIFAILFFTLAVSAPLIIKFLSDNIDLTDTKKVSDTVELFEPPPIDEKTPPPPAVPPPPPVRSTIRFTPPVVTPDDKAEDPPPPQEELAKTDAGKETVEGDPNADVNLDGLDNEVTEDNTVYTFVDEMPSFKSGSVGNFLGSVIKYTPLAQENGVEGKVFVEFTVDPEGNITNVQVKRGLGFGLDEAAIAAIKKTKGMWNPGRQNGRAVKVSFTVPVVFKLK